VKIVLQRVEEASVSVGKEILSQIQKGVCILVGIEKGDSEDTARSAADKIIRLRIFPDADGKMNLSLVDVQGELLAISQFTLASNIKKGRRPSFDRAEHPARAQVLFDNLVACLRSKDIRVKTGRFGAFMKVSLTNDGPVTFIIEK